MRTIMWNPSGSRRATTSQTISRVAFLVLMVGVLVVGSLVLKPDAAHAQTTIAGNHSSTRVQTQVHDGAITRLETFEVRGDDPLYDVIDHRWSDDNGASWSAWTSLGLPMNHGFFIGSTSLVSSAPGHLDAFARDDLGYIENDTSTNGQWSGWRKIPNQDEFLGAGAVCMGSICYSINSDPAVSSWGPGRVDLFFNGLSSANGAVALLHTWADNNTWSGSWEVLGTGLMQDNAAAVSWGPGRVDVFVRGGGDELDHKWFANGHWSSGWENLGGNVTSSPTVMSWQPGFLAIFARNASAGLSEDLYGNGFWSGWGDLDSNSISIFGLAAASSPGFWHVFAIAPHGHLMYKRESNGSWSTWQDLDSSLAFGLATVVWDPIPLTTTPPPPPPKCGVPGKPPCPRDP